MTTTQTIANTYAERLLIAKDKQKATNGILRRMSKLRYKGHTEPISLAGKKKIIALIRARVAEASTPGTEKTNYSTMIAYMLDQVSSD